LLLLRFDNPSSLFPHKLVLEVVKWPVPFLQAYFYKKPEIEFALQFGEQKFQGLAQLVSSQLTHFLVKQAVYPHGWVYHLSNEGQSWLERAREKKRLLGDVLNQPGVLMVVIHHAFKMLDPGNYYLLAQVGNQKHETKTCERGNNPVWNEVACFDLRKVDAAEGKKRSFFCVVVVHLFMTTLPHRDPEADSAKRLLLYLVSRN